MSDHPDSCEFGVIHTVMLHLCPFSEMRPTLFQFETSGLGLELIFDTDTYSDDADRCVFFLMGNSQL